MRTRKSRFMETIGVENYLNAILVNKNVRPAMLIQPVDYGEISSKDPKTKLILETLQSKFPSFLLSEQYQGYQGIIVSKKNYNGMDISLEKMGQSLGYPCYKDYTRMDENEIHYTINLCADYKKKKIQLFANVCKDKSSLVQFNQIAARAKTAFKELNINVYVETTTIIPTQVVIDKIIKGVELDEDDLRQADNVLENLGFTQKIDIMDFQLRNPIHTGVLLGILLRDKNDVLSPFYPLQEHPQLEECKKIQDKWVVSVKKTLRSI